VTEVNQQKKRGCRTPMLSLLILAILMVGGYFWFNTSLGRLFQSIVGGSSIGLSESMEPFELKFRTLDKDVSRLEAKGLPPKEWSLAIPRAYVVDVTGRSGTFQPDGPFIVNFEMVVDAAGNVTGPITFATKQSFPTKSVNIKTSNSGGMKRLTGIDDCIKTEDYRSFLMTRGVDSRHFGICDDRSPRCAVHTFMDGWRLELFIPRSFYLSDHRLVCNSVRALFDKYTVRRDPL
jgi:hypothetical protein